MTNTIPNVPRELLERIAELLSWKGGISKHLDDVRGAYGELRALLSAPSPAGVDGLEVVAYLIGGEPSLTQCPVRGVVNEPLCLLSDAQGIVGGLLGEVAAQEETANQWRELALQFDRHRMTAMAHIRAAASGDKSAIEALGVFAALPPIPGHEITAERDQQAKRISKLAGLLQESLATHRMWADVAPAVSLCSDIEKALAELAG